MADTGWVNAGTAQTISGAEENEGYWLDPDNAKTSNNAWAQSIASKHPATEWLRMTNFTFGIPAGSTILGIEVKIERHADDPCNAHDASLRLIKDGVVSGDDKASAVIWPTSDGTVEYGGAGDLWNSGYGYADVTDSGFGMQIYGHHDTTDFFTMEVDHIAIKITYTPPAVGYEHDVNDVPALNIASINDVPAENINTINEV